MQGRLTLQRLDENTSLRDDLTYEYNIGTNRLRNTDTADGENYTYDEIGNLISDVEEGIDSISWTPYGKVRKVEKSDNSLVSFRYDASGNRIAKISDGDTTVYVRDASGNVMGVYKNDTLIEQSIYGSSRLGLMTVSSKTGYRTLGGKKYELSNHLGNVLAVVSDNINLDQDSTWASVVNVTDYYPFGLGMDGRTVQDSSYRYGFNGKEEDSNGEWGSKSHYDYGFRIYNPSIAKFLSVDPLTKDFPFYTPYQFAGNKPIYAIDLDGAEELPYWDRSEYNSAEGALSKGWRFAGNSLKSIYNDAAGTWNYGVQITKTGIHEGPLSAAQKVKSDATDIGLGIYHYSTGTSLDEFGQDVKDVLNSVETYEQGVGGLATFGVGAALKASKIGKLSPIVNAGDRFSPVNPGPLPEAIAKTFRGASYSESFAENPLTLYRSYGGNAKELGSYWTRTQPTGPLQSTIDSALDPSWGNTAEKVSSITIPKGTTFYEGAVAPQGNLIGGGNQIYIPKESLNPDWLNK